MENNLPAKNSKELQVSSTSILRTENNSYEISVYNDELTKEFAAKMTEKIVKTFPKLSSQFFDIFYDRIRDNGFTDKRLKDAVNYVIDNCQYPEPTIAQFISFDKTVKLF